MPAGVSRLTRNDAEQITHPLGHPRLLIPTSASHLPDARYDGAAAAVCRVPVWTAVDGVDSHARVVRPHWYPGTPTGYLLATPPRGAPTIVIKVERSFDVNRQPDIVVNYLKDFANAVEWDPGTKRCVQQDTGPIQVGTTWDNVSEIRGRETELTYRLTRLEPGHLIFQGTNKTATSTDDITITASGDGAGSSITYRAEIQFNGLAKLAGPFLAREFERLGDETRDSIIAAVARLSAT